MSEVTRERLAGALETVRLEVEGENRRIDDLSSAAIADRLLAALGPQADAASTLADRVTEILADSGYTDARQVFPGGFLITGGPGQATTGCVIVSVPWTDATDGERRRLLARFAEALRDGGLYVTGRPHYLEVRTMPGEARDGR